MKQPTSIMNNKANWTFGCPSILYMFYRESGKLEECVEYIKEAMSHYYLLNRGQGSGAEYVMEAERYFNLGDFDNAEISMHKALHKSQANLQASITLCAVFLQIRLAFMKGDFMQMLESLQKMRSDMSSKKEYHFLHTVEICEGSIYAYLKQKHKIPPRLLEGDLTNLRLRFPAFAAFNIMYGRILLINGEYLKLIGSAEHFISIASVFPNLLGIIYTYIYLAAANRQISREDEALANLKQALATALPDTKSTCPLWRTAIILKRFWKNMRKKKYIRKILPGYSIYIRPTVKTGSKSSESISAGKSPSLPDGNSK